MWRGKSRLEISEERLRHNYRALTEAAAVDVLAVVKANAYGHGAELCAPVLAAAGASWLGVTDAEEGARVRRALAGRGAGEPNVLVMCGLLPEEARSMVEHRLTPVVWTREQIGWMSEAAGSGTGRVGVHLEIDTGMSRQGVRPGAELGEVLRTLSGSAKVRVTGVLTHFASAEIAGSLLTALQRERFEAALEQIAAAGVQPEWVHVGNTSTVDEGSGGPWLAELATRFGGRAMLRSGLALYGYCLPLEGGRGELRELLKPVLTWRSRVLATEELRAGATVGYNGTFTAPGRMRVALLPVGYADGLRRELSGTNGRPGGWVMVGGRRAPIVGRISMNLTTVDVSAIPEVKVGDEVVVLGEGVSAEEHAGLAGTIPYEILCGLRAPAELIA